MIKSKLSVLVAAFMLAIVLLSACAPASASNSPDTELGLDLNVPVLAPDYYIVGKNGLTYYEVVTFTDNFGRNCTSVLSLYSDAGPALFCQ